MIHWITKKRHSYTIQRHLAAFGKALAGEITVINYRNLERNATRDGIYVMADIERLSERERARYSIVCDRLKASGRLVLNRPDNVRLRYSLLRGLAKRGKNHFNVYRHGEVDQCGRFPVYLRCENDHKGSRSELLRSHAELEKEVNRHTATRLLFRDEHSKLRLIRLGAQRQRELLVTEFCDTADENGIYRKYAAFCVAGTIVPRHLLFGTEWMLKAPQLLTPEFLEEEREYVNTNPHEQRLKEVFAFARIDYGRIDYAVREGKIQVWEINTNPMLTAPVDEQTPERFPVQESFAAQFQKALLSLADNVALPSAA
jgi:hypothetical protein